MTGGVAFEMRNPSAFSTLTTRQNVIQFREARYNSDAMSKKPRKKKRSRPNQQKSPPQKNAKYSAGEIAMAILGGALLIMVAGIIITSLLG